MRDVKALDENARPYDTLNGSNGRPIDLEQYMSEHLYMFTSDLVRVQMQIPKEMISDIIDKYIKRKDLEIATLMAKVLGVSYYPDDEKPYEFDTARQFIEGFLNSLANENYDISSNITIPFDAGSHESTVERVSFDESFDKEIKINMEQYEE